jgi:plasmid maintenance system antidote protein VapI
MEEYYSPKDILITIGDEVEIINLTGLINYHTEEIKREVYPFIPTYFKLIINPGETYLFVSPFPENTIYVEGDLINIDKNNNITINTDLYIDPDELFMLFDSKEVTIAIFGSEPFVATFYVEKYNSLDMPISEYIRDEDPINIPFNQFDCTIGRKKYILGVYNKEDIDQNQEKITKYWTSKNGGDFNVYYRNNITLEGESLLPYDDKYKQKKEFTIQLYGYFDFFTITCNEPGIFSLRSPYLAFDEPIYKIGQNSYNHLEIEYDVNIIQLTAPMRPTVNYLYFALYSTEGKKIKIVPDSPQLFNETTIEGDNIFKLKVDLYKFKSDELAIRVNSTGDTNIEAVEVIQYNYTEFTILDEEIWKHITDNQFVKFINRKTKKISVIIKGLKDVTINYALVKVFTDDPDYLPMAYMFKDQVKAVQCKETEEIEIENTYFGEKDDNKKYLALIFSIPQAKYFEYEAIIYEDLKNKIPWLIIIITAVSAIVFVSIIFIIICIVKNKKKETPKLEMDVENVDNEPLDQENSYKGINDDS